jgi:hypothetical protein
LINLEGKEGTIRKIPMNRGLHKLEKILVDERRKKIRSILSSWG